MKLIWGLLWGLAFNSFAAIPTTRVVVEGVKFPIDNQEVGQLTPHVAFPALTFNRPVVLTHAGDGSDTLYVVEQDGRIQFFENDANVPEARVFLDIRGQVERGGNEQGLLGLAFDPDYRNNGFFYVFYSARQGRRHSVVSRFQMNPVTKLADPASEKILIEIALPPEFTNHNGGMLAFGPEGYLYIGVGDGGSGDDPQNHAQNRKSLLGKILRLDPHAAAPHIPSDNPFVGSAQGYRAEIWAYGLRNPWRFSFDSDGTLWCADVGQNRMEEIDLIKRGGNYGWRIYEGTLSHLNPGGLPPSQFESPIWAYLQSEGGKSVTGGYVYRGARLSSLRGAYVYGDYVSGNVWALRIGANGTINKLIARLGQLAAFGLSRDQELFGLSFDGRIYRFDENQTVPSQAFPRKLSETGLFENLGSLTPTPGIIEYDVNVALWSDGARKRRWVMLPGRETIGFQPTSAWKFPVGTIFIKHFELEQSPGQVRRLETRVLVHERAGWAGYTYRWNAAQTDALLINQREQEVFEIQDALGVRRTQTWTYPSRSDCLNCHTPASGYVLGARTAQMNREFNYGGETGSQLAVWSQIQFFDQSVSGGVHAKYPALSDESVNVGERARAYLAVNCANCHLPLGPTPTNIDLRFETGLAQTNLLGVGLSNIQPQVPGEIRLRPGDKSQSALWNLMRRRSGKFMPPLATSEIDRQGTDLTGRWIDSLSSSAPFVE